MSSTGLFQRFDNAFMLDGVRTPMVDYMGAFGDANPIDLGIKAAKAVFARTGIAPTRVDSVLAGNMAPGGFDQFYLPRHIGLYAGVPREVPALMVQRICGTGFELFRQAGEQIATGATTLALVVGTESMTRNPIAAFDHRSGFKLGAPLGFKDYMWEALTDPAAAVSMIQTAEGAMSEVHELLQRMRELVDSGTPRSRWRGRGECDVVGRPAFSAPLDCGRLRLDQISHRLCGHRRVPLRQPASLRRSGDG